MNELDWYFIKYYCNCFNNRVPQSVDEAVDLLYKYLTCRFAHKVLRMTPKKFAALYHHTLGMYIRNCFRLWDKDSKIIEELGGVDADEASGIILEKLWHKFNEECPRQKGKGISKILTILNKILKVLYIGKRGASLTHSQSN